MRKILLIIGVVFGFSTYAQAFLIDFEDGTDGGEVNSNITGVTFLDFNGYSSLYGDCSTSFYNCTSDDLGYSHDVGAYHLNGNFFLWAGQNADARGVIIDFTNNDGTWFQTGYSSYSDFFVEAYLTDGSMVSVMGSSNTGNPMDYLLVNATAGLYIDYIVLHDTGNQWLADDMSGDASGVNVPEPASLFLLGMGLLGFGVMRRQQA